jgi:hypothetical protein
MASETLRATLRSALERARPFAELAYAENGGDEAADAKDAMREIDKALAALDRPTPADDDRSAVTFWLPKSQDRREALALTFEEMARVVRAAPPETGLG